MKEEIKLAIQGYNAEKLAIQNRIAMLGGNNEDIPKRSDANTRLREIDRAIAELLSSFLKHNSKGSQNIGCQDT